MADEAREERDFEAWDAEAVADEVVERQFQFHAGFGQPQHGVARVAAFFADSSTGNFSFGDEGADVVFGSVGVDRNFRAFENAQEPVLVLKQPSEQPVERDVACAGAFEDAIETGAQELGLFRSGRQLVFLQGAIEPPDHPLGDLDGVALLVVGGNQLMGEPFRVDPAQRVRADAKLARVVGNNVSGTSTPFAR